MELLNNGCLGPGLYNRRGLSSFWMSKCTSTKEKGPQSVSFIEMFFFYCVLYSVSFIRGSTVQFESCVRSHGEQELKGEVEDDVVDELEVGDSVRE